MCTYTFNKYNKKVLNIYKFHEKFNKKFYKPNNSGRKRLNIGI